MQCELCNCIALHACACVLDIEYSMLVGSSTVILNGARLLQCSSVEEFDELLSGLMHSRGEEGEGGGERRGGGEEGGGVGGGRSYQEYQHRLKFVFHSMDGREEELCSGGSQMYIT